MASSKDTKPNESIADEWLEEDKLMLLECWSRDGYTFQDISNKIGISPSTLRVWKKKYIEIKDALKNGREIIDYKVENALLKSALGYRTKEIKVITTMRFGKVIETIKEVTEKDQTPNVSACQVWLYNRCQDKWKKNRDNIIEIDDEDTHIQVTVTRANTRPEEESNNKDVDKEWQDEINTSVTLSNKKSDTEEDRTLNETNSTIKVPSKDTVVDLDAWPDDWEEED